MLIHVVYFALVALAYHGAELSFAYPVMRGSAPVLSALAVVLLLSETPTPGGWLGILLVSGGVLLLGSGLAGIVTGVVLPVGGGFMGALATGQIDISKMMRRAEPAQ